MVKKVKLPHKVTNLLLTFGIGNGYATRELRKELNNYFFQTLFYLMKTGIKLISISDVQLFCIPHASCKHTLFVNRI